MALELAKFVSLHSETDDGKKEGGERILGFTVSIPADNVPPSSSIHSKWKRLSHDHSVASLVLITTPSVPLI